VAKTNFNSVDEYMASLPGPARRVLARVRSIVRRALPGAEEAISYQIPTYKQGGRPVIYFAAWKEHYSIYPATGPVLSAFKDDLAAYEVSKGTIRFPLSQAVPVKLITAIAKLRSEEVSNRTTSKRITRTKR